eukprot:COSAG01_NODE_5715_length_4082_cov_2.185287_1_plen_73_part_00
METCAFAQLMTLEDTSLVRTLLVSLASSLLHLFLPMLQLLLRVHALRHDVCFMVVVARGCHYTHACVFQECK